jgi:UDP-glucose 4-epimerase
MLKIKFIQEMCIKVTNKKFFLVTGGAGFIGSHLCERLSKDSNNKVYSLDNYFTGSESNHMPNVTYIKGDTKDISKLITFKPDTVYHLGEYSRVEQSFDDIEKVWASNKDGTFAVLEFVRKSASKIIYAGSSTKFGDGGMGREATPYAWTKATNTELVMNYGQWFDVPYAITYFYNVYGPREIQVGKYATLIAIFKEKIKNNESLTVVSPGTQKRNFTHINDIIEALILVGENGFGDEFGIGCDDSYTIKQIAEMFGGKIEMIPERRGNRMTADVISHKTKALGWSAKERVEDYIKEVTKGCKK